MDNKYRSDLFNRSAQQRVNDLRAILNNREIQPPAWLNDGYEEVQSKPKTPEFQPTMSNGRSNNETSTKVKGQNQQMPGFRTAREEAMLRSLKKTGKITDFCSKAAPTKESLPAQGRAIGLRRTVDSKFTSPICAESSTEKSATATTSNILQDPKLAHLDPKMVEQIESDILKQINPIAWDDIKGHDYAKSVIMETVVKAMLRPDIFCGTRSPPKGVLLFGPPGTGKTLIGKCIASQSGSTFFSISSSSVTSKYIGEGEKMVRTLFAVAAKYQPSVIFIDEVDALLSQRSDSEHESSRRLKNEFFTQMEGATTSAEDRIIVVGATNRPQELDDAARRRFARRLYIPLPDLEARIKVLEQQFKGVKNNFTQADLEEIGVLCEGYSCADLKILSFEASVIPIRSIPMQDLLKVDKNDLPPVTIDHVRLALDDIQPSVAQSDIQQYIEWNQLYGSKAKGT